MHEPLLIEFSEEHRSPVVTRMVAMSHGRDGWINFTPGLDVDVAPTPRSALTTLFGAKGPDIPLATWKPSTRKDREPSTVGIQHAQGPKVIARLAQAGYELPEGWRKLQDHPKRGLVCAVPTTNDRDHLDDMLAWLLYATAALCPLPRTGEWRALCY